MFSFEHGSPIDDYWRPLKHNLYWWKITSYYLERGLLVALAITQVSTHQPTTTYHLPMMMAVRLAHPDARHGHHLRHPNTTHHPPPTY